MESGKKKGGKLHKKGGKGLKNAPFWAINSKKAGFARRKLICQGKKLISKEV